MPQVPSDIARLVFTYIKQHPGIEAKYIAAEFNVQGDGVARVLDELHDIGWVEYRFEPAEKRKGEKRTQVMRLFPIF